MIGIQRPPSIGRPVATQESTTSPTPYKLNRDQTVAVAEGVYWNPDMSTCPRGTKVQLKGKGGVAHYHNYNGDSFWIGWAPLPRDLPEPE